MKINSSCFVVSYLEKLPLTCPTGTLSRKGRGNISPLAGEMVRSTKEGATRGFTPALVPPTPAQKHCGAGSAEAANYAGYNAGFTLIELLVVVLIIGILAAVALPQYQKAVEKARFAEAMTNLKTLAQASDACQLNKGAQCSWDELDLVIGTTPDECFFSQNGKCSVSSTKHFHYLSPDYMYIVAHDNIVAGALYAEEDVCICLDKSGDFFIRQDDCQQAPQTTMDYSRVLNLAEGNTGCTCC